MQSGWDVDSQLTVRYVEIFTLSLKRHKLRPSDSEVSGWKPLEACTLNFSNSS